MNPPTIRPDDPLDFPERPARSYDEALDRAARFDTGSTHELLPTSATRLFVHGVPTRRVVVLWHGITNNPQQWAAFGQQVHTQLHANVLIPRLPLHGHAHRTTSLPARLSAQDMARYTSESVDIAQGLGDEIAVVGLSAGGVYAAWAAQRRDCVRLAISIAPFFCIKAFPAATMPALAALARALPNKMGWWNPMLRDKNPPPHAYPMFSTRGLAATIQLGTWVRRKATTSAPFARRIVFVNNEFDLSVNNGTTNALASTWKAHGSNVEVHTFDDDPNLPHDMIDITQPKGKTRLVYAKLSDYLDD